MRILVAVAIVVLGSLAGCRSSMEYAYEAEAPAGEYTTAADGRLVPPRARSSTAMTPVAAPPADPAVTAGVIPRPVSMPFGWGEIPRDRNEVLHKAIRKRLLKVQYLVQHAQAIPAQQELRPLLALEEAQAYYAPDMEMLNSQIARQMERPKAVNEGAVTEARAMNEVRDRYRLPDTYGETRIISPDLSPLELPPGRMEEVLNQRVARMDLEGAGVADIVQALRQVVGLNIIADQALESAQELTVHVTDVPLSELLSYISRNMGIAFHLGENIIWVTEAATPDDSGPKLETRIYTLRKGYIPGGSSASGGFGTADSVGFGGGGGGGGGGASEGQDDLLNALTDFLEDNPYNPPNTKFQIYRNRNLLVVRNNRENLRLAEELIREFDAMPKQVLIEARFVTLNQTDLFQLGGELESITYDGGERINATGGVSLPGFAQPLAMNQLQVSGILDNFTYDIVVEALEKLGSTRTISSPRITVLNNQSASIRRGTTTYYFQDFEVEETITDNVISSRLVPSGTAEELQLGISLATTPSIGNDSASILLSIAAEIAGPAAEFITRNDVALPEFPESTLETSVGVNSGQTVVLGGMITSEQSETETKVPFLGDVPLLGALFRKRERNSNPEHLLIFVTATIVDQDGRYNSVLDTADFGVD